MTEFANPGVIINSAIAPVATAPVIAPEEVKAIKLAEWHAALEAALAAKPLLEKEQALRKEVAELFFPNPKEGTNTFDLATGWKLKLTHKIDRKMDEVELETVKAQVRELGVNPDLLVSMKPSLDTKAYKALVLTNPEAVKVFDLCLTIKPASPTMELVPPKGK
jgi:hypothetical protein